MREVPNRYVGRWTWYVTCPQMKVHVMIVCGQGYEIMSIEETTAGVGPTRPNSTPNAQISRAPRARQYNRIHQAYFSSMIGEHATRMGCIQQVTHSLWYRPIPDSCEYFDPRSISTPNYSQDRSPPAIVNFLFQ